MDRRKFMFQAPTYSRVRQPARSGFGGIPQWAKSIGVLLSVTGALAGRAQIPPLGLDTTPVGSNPGHCVTNAAQFRNLSGADYLSGCDFHLTGVVTLVDPNRDLVVLQDASGAVALNFWNDGRQLHVGQLVTLDGTNCCPYFAALPDYPYRPSGWDIRNSFEAPMNWGEYHLTRMRGYLHPPATGQYSFWVASDNSSELWLSADANPSKARKIAWIPRYGWVSPHEWSRFPSQRSEPILLKADETYYIEALQEQTTLGDHLSVAWAGPSLGQGVISGRYLTPWGECRGPTDIATNGMLREYWTNYSAGDLSGLGGARAFESALTVKEVRVNIHGPGQLPNAERIALNQRLSPENNYRWVQVEGAVKFAGANGGVAFLELSDGQAQVQVRGLHWSPELLKRIGNALVRVQGVCEGAYDQKETLVPGLIWASGEDCISLAEASETRVSAVAVAQPALASMTNSDSARQGFYGMRGVVTFNDRVFENDYIFVQGNAAAVLVASDRHPLKSHLTVGRWVDLGGGLEPGKYVPVITPLVVTELGWHTMPPPVTQPLSAPDPASREGRWSELEGVVHAVNTNGTLSLLGKEGPACLWVGQTASNHLASYVDAKLRVRGVLLLTLFDTPLLLVPSPDFVEVEEAAPEDPFGMPRRAIADLLPAVMESSWPHRARVVGEITYRNAHSFFIQDGSGGIQVQAPLPPGLDVGNTVQVLAFPSLKGFIPTMTDPLVRPAKPLEQVKPRSLDLSEALSSKQSGNLVQVSATFLSCKTNGISQILELQEQQRVFTATLTADRGRLPDILPGSHVRVMGVCDNTTTVLSQAGEKSAGAQTLASLNILLRSPADVIVLGGPPWWTWKRTAALVSALLTVLFIALLWVHLLRRRLERQQAARLAFSRQVLKRLEDERRRIAINLHDSLGQILLAIKNQAVLAMQRSADEPGLRQRLDEISGASSQAIEEVRQITQGLRPYQLDRLGLTQAIRAAVSLAAETSRIQFASRVEDMDGALGKDSEIHVYRIVQEAVNNVIKHSAATEATVVIKRRPGVVALSIRDNGRGFDVGTLDSASPSGAGSGLSGIAERVRILNGKLTMNSRPGEGTSLTIEVPLPADSHETGSNHRHGG